MTDTRPLQSGGLTRLITRAKATRAQTRLNNIRLALQIIYSRAPTSRAAVARESGLTPATASALVDELLEKGVIKEVGTGKSAGGKPPTLIAPDPQGRSIVSLDLSSLYFRGALVDLTGKVISTTSVESVSGRAGLQAVAELVDRLASQATNPLLGVGFGTPGVVNPDRGVVTSTNLDWVDAGLADSVSEVTDAPIHIINDAHAAALHEYSVHAPHVSDFALVRVGRGIGTGFVLDGHVYRGVNSATGEIGHIRLDEDGEVCTCGNQGCLETKASMASLLREVGGSQALTHERIAEIAKDPIAEPAISRAAVELGRALASAVALLAVREIALWGEVTALGEHYRKTVQDEIRSRVLPVNTKRIHVRYATAGQDAVILGSAGLVLSTELGVVW